LALENAEEGVRKGFLGGRPPKKQRPFTEVGKRSRGEESLVESIPYVVLLRETHRFMKSQKRTCVRKGENLNPSKITLTEKNVSLGKERGSKISRPLDGSKGRGRSREESCGKHQTHPHPPPRKEKGR